MDYMEIAKRLRNYEWERDDDGKCYGCPDEESYYPCCVDCFSRTHRQAADAIEQLQALVPRWIPVTEEPPLKVGDEGYNGYLVYANGYYEVADYTTDKFDNVPSFHVNGEYEPDVTHYMPIPTPPKEET